MTNMRIAVDYLKCSGLGMCEAEAPGVFQVGDDGQVECLTDAPAEELRGAVLAACDACPTGALSVRES